MYERVGISLVEVYERVRKSVTSVCKKNQKGWKMYFMAVKKSRKQVLVSDLFIFKRRCIYRDTETTVILSEFTCKIVFTKKKNSPIGKPSNVFDKLDWSWVYLFERENPGGALWGKLFSTQSGQKTNKQTNKQFCNVTGDTQITSDLGIARMDTLTLGYPKH